MSAPGLAVVDAPDEGRYELRRGDELLGFAQYRPAGDHRVILPHTEIDEGHEHEGLGSTLARGVLDDLRRQGVEIVPTCPFISAFIDRHPEYDDLVTPALRRER